MKDRGHTKMTGIEILHLLEQVFDHVAIGELPSSKMLLCPHIHTENLRRLFKFLERLAKSSHIHDLPSAPSRLERLTL
jgi:hypothetical protein